MHGFTRGRQISAFQSVAKAVSVKMDSSTSSACCLYRFNMLLNAAQLAVINTSRPVEK